MSSTTHDRTATPTPTDTAAVCALVAAVGPRQAYAQLGLGRHTVDRIRGGLPVQRATLTHVRVALASLGLADGLGVQP